MSQSAELAQLDENQEVSPASRLVRFVEHELSPGAALLLATMAALVLANSPLAHGYESLLTSHFGFSLGAVGLHLAGHEWINDALMALFFFSVGLEIKHETTHGDLRSPRQAVVPVIAALGGMIAPAAIFLVWAGSGSGASGWGVPMATDIAFALAVLGVAGRGLPSGLRTFLLALAVADDLGAILVIAIFYSGSVSMDWLLVAALGLALVVAMKRIGVVQIALYVPVGVVVWYATLQSGVHATIAGVALGLLTPTFARDGGTSPAARLQSMLGPWVNFLILPIFALSNAGVVLSPGRVTEAITSPVGIGITSGLVLGKAVGILVSTRLCVKSGIGELPGGMTDDHLVGLSLLAGIGFTVSLFVTGLAYSDPGHVEAAKTAILLASLIAATSGSITLRGHAKRHVALQETSVVA